MNCGGEKVLNFAQGSIWAAALAATDCCTEGSSGRQRVEWESAPDHLRYVARQTGVLQPFGIPLEAGNVLEVRWSPGATAYDLRVQGQPH